MHYRLSTLGELREEFLAWLAREVAAGRTALGTLLYYKIRLARFVAAVGGPERLLAELIPYDLERCKTGWHSVQSVQRMFNWGVKLQLIGHNPFAGIELPERGERERVLEPAELATLLREARRPFRFFLLAMRSSLARPQEIRALRWGDLLPDLSAFRLKHFKGKKRRKDGAKCSWLCIDRRLRRLLERLREREPSGPDEPVFLNSRGRAWTANGARCAMRRLRVKCGLDYGVEPVVCYTLRHTAATQATANGVRDKLLAKLMGHASTRTTARYQHLQASHLAAAIDQATRRRAA